MFQSPLVQDLQNRGLIAQTTDINALDELLAKESVTLYAGGAMIRLELVTLSNVFLQAMRNKSKTGITVNPIYTGRENFEKKEERLMIRPIWRKDCI